MAGADETDERAGFKAALERAIRARSASRPDIAAGVTNCKCQSKQLELSGYWRRRT